MNKKEYQKQWIANKRARSKRKAEPTPDSSDSDTSDSDTSHAVSAKLLRPVPVCSTQNCLQIETASNAMSEMSSVTSSDDSPLSDEDAWDDIDVLCNTFSDTSNSEDDLTTKFDLRKKLQEWAVECDVTHNQLNKLLPLLKELDSTLPCTAKTLLKSTDSMPCNVKMCSGGDYLYIGISVGLSKLITKNMSLLADKEVIELTLNIDGLPLFHSSTYSLWPVLCSATNINSSYVFPIALYGGKTKPADLEFLTEAIEELSKLLNEGITVHSKKFHCILKFIVCDAPARCMVKCTKQFSGYYGCDKCCQKGIYVGRVTYPECDSPMRDDESFRSHLNEEHHNGDSPFCNLPIDMVKCFPIDYMHQSCLGVMKRLLLCWNGGLKKAKLSVSQKAMVNMRLSMFRQCATSDFTRKPRTLDDLTHWKATEFRTFLLYTGYFVLYKIMNDEMLSHFLTLVVALRILVTRKLAVDSEHRTFAHERLLEFVKKSEYIYGKEFIVYNVHCLTHLCQEVAHFGQLDNFSAFVFENYMQTLKKYVRSGKNPIVQICNRLKEHDLYSSSVATEQKSAESCELQFFSCVAPNNACILVTGHCCQVLHKGQKSMTCMVFSNTEPVYTDPVDSRVVGVYKVRLSSGTVKHLPLNALASKAIYYAQFSQDSSVFIELLHTV